MFRNLTLLIVFLALLIVIAGTFGRLSNAGLACPDWPGCFGQFLPFGDPETGGQVGQAPAPDTFMVRLEMARRYLLALNGVAIVLLWLASLFVKANRSTALIPSSLLLLGVALQIGLDHWVVASKLMPFFVLGQYLAGLLVLSLAFWLFLKANPNLAAQQRPPHLGGWIRFAVIVLVLQMSLGQWTAANYAAPACPDFPTCMGSWWPDSDYSSGFSAPAKSNSSFQGGNLSHQARIAIHWSHRIGALVSFLILGGLALAASSSRLQRQLRKAGVTLSGLLLIQVALGIGTVILRGSVPVGVAHSAVAAVLLLTLVYMAFWSKRTIARLPQESSAESGPIDEIAVDSTGTAVIPEAVAEVQEPEAEPVSLFHRLTSQLHRTRSGLTDALATLSLGKKEIDHELLEEIEANLIMADIGVDATRDIIDNLTQNVQRNQLNDSGALSQALRDNLLGLLQPCDAPLKIEAGGKTFVILVVGVNGVGKTTTIGKLAKRLQADGLSVMLAAGDTFRAAAVEQLQTWGERNKIPVVAQHSGADSASVVFDALQSAQARGIDVLIADTAGRLHTKDNLMEELRKVKRIMGKLDPDAPHEVLLVVDAGTGQNALSQAEQFNQVVGLTGIALTKLDGTAKGGVIFALAKRLAIPIRFIGIGEGINDLQDFNAESFIDALFATELST